MSDPEEDRLELEELRALWRSLEAPVAAEELSELDAGTRRAVGWMQRAWREVEVPAARVPRTLAPQTRDATPLRDVVVAGNSRARWPELLALAAGLLLVFLAGRGLWLDGRPETAEGPRVADGAGARPSDAEIENTRPHVAAVNEDHVALRSGRVTLLVANGVPGVGREAGL